MLGDRAGYGVGLTGVEDDVRKYLNEEPLMDTMNIALPESMKLFVQERVSEGGFSSVSEHVRELIRSEADG